MKKRRTLSRKVIVPILSILLAVSAFFYAPMDVCASGTNIYNDSFSAQLNTELNGHKFYTINFSYDDFSVGSSMGTIDSGSYYEVTFDTTVSFTSTVGTNLRIPYLTVGNYLFWTGDNVNALTSYSQVSERTFVFKGSELTTSMPVFLKGYVFDTDYILTDFTADVFINLVSYQEVSSDTYDEYQNGYDAGYAEGFSQGESSGYSSGYETGYEAGESAGYDAGFTAGVDSVDTQSYYDAGYTAGYNSGYSVGYDTGYDEGWSNAMATIESWGADGTNYPVLITEFDVQRDLTHVASTTKADEIEYVNFAYYPALDAFDPNHTYALRLSDISFDLVSYDEVPLIWFENIYAYSGSSRFIIDGVTDTGYLFFPGNMAGSIGVSYQFIYQSMNLSINDIQTRFTCHYELFDFGPAGDTQNHIANQTDELTNGYDNSAGESTSSQFSDGVAEYEEVEGSLFTSAKSGLQDYEFFNLESVPAVITGLSFVTSIMTSIFNSMGGASGAGIVLSVLFSVMLVSIVAGLYRYFVSSGKSGRHNKKGGGS